MAQYPPPEAWDDWDGMGSPTHWPQEGGPALHAGADRLLQLRVGLRPARLGGQRDAARSASSRATRCTPAAAVATAPRARRRSTRSTTPTASSTRSSAPASAARARWVRVSLGRGAGRYRRAHPRRPSWRSATTRSCTTSAAPGTTASWSGCCPAWGVDGHNSHTNICSSGRARRLRVLDGLRPAQPRPRQRQRHPAHQQPPRDRATTSTRTPSASSRARWPAPS